MQCQWPLPAISLPSDLIRSMLPAMLRRVMSSGRLLAVCAALAVASCGLARDPNPPVLHARFDPDAKVIPMPTDVLRDADANRLALPVDDADLTDAEREFYTFL